MAPRFLSKVNYVIYGYEFDLFKNKSLKSFVLKKIFKRIPFFLTHIKDDVFKLNTITKGKGEFIYNQVYFSNVAPKVVVKIKTELPTKLNFLIGNSRDASNQHEFLIDYIVPFKEKINEIFIPLSYGNNFEYAEKVKNRAFEKFPNVSILENFMPLNEYLTILENIHIALFHHERQEAMGVTIQLIAMGKPIFMNPNSPAYKSLIRRGFSVFKITELNNYLLDNNILNQDVNFQLISEFYSEENFILNWKKLLK
jgi:hypothetical protein